MLGRAEAEGRAQEAGQQRALRAATQLRGQLAAARERCDALSLDLRALLLRRRRREAAAAAEAAAGEQQEGQQGGAVAAALQDLFGDSSSEDEGGATEAAASGRRRRAQNTAAGPGDAAQRQARGAQLGRRQRRQQQQQGSADEDFVSPYLSIVDPAAPRPRPAQPAQQQAAAGADGSPAEAAAAAQRAPPQRSSSLPEEVRRRLAAAAPQLPAGFHTQFWDTKSGGWPRARPGLRLGVGCPSLLLPDARNGARAITPRPPRPRSLLTCSPCCHPRTPAAPRSPHLRAQWAGGVQPLGAGGCAPG